MNAEELYFKGYSIREIAKILGKSKSSVWRELRDITSEKKIKESELLKYGLDRNTWREIANNYNIRYIPRKENQYFIVDLYFAIKQNRKLLMYLRKKGIDTKKLIDYLYQFI